MNIKKTNDTKKKITIEVEGDLTIYSANDFKNHMVKYCAKSKDIEIDLSKVVKFDTAGFQLVILARREIENANNKLIIKNLSNEVKTIFDLYGAII